MILAIDIGGSKLLLGAVTPNGQVVRTHHIDLPPNHNAEFLLAEIRKGIASLGSFPYTACGAAIPGLCDRARKMWRYAPFTGIENLPMKKLLSQMTGLPVSIDNDVNCSALAERMFGLCKDKRDFLWITISNGVGGGLFLGGKLWRGPFGVAGEVGHMKTGADTVCVCGGRGCLESVASGASIAAIYRRKTGLSLSARQIAARAQDGEQAAQSVFCEAGEALGLIISHAVHLLGIDTVVVGGGVSASFELFAPSAQRVLEEAVFHAAIPKVHLLRSPLGDSASLLGCAALALSARMKKGK